MKDPLVSVIVTTRNNTQTLHACLRSIIGQSYRTIELIVVDNYSTDDTVAIASQYTEQVYTQGPERCTQRNFGVAQSHGDYVLIIDSDMELSKKVVEACVTTAKADTAVKGIIIPEESFGIGFWAQCKRLERSFYVGVDAIEAARFFDKTTYRAVGGYDETLISGEDWDLSRRVGTTARIARIPEFIFHNEGRLKVMRSLKKKYYYAQAARAYFLANPTSSALTDQSGPLARYKLFFSHPIKLFKNPIIGVGMLLLKTAEYFYGGLGYFRATHTKPVVEGRQEA